MTARRPMLSLGLDLDNLWSYMKIHGDRGWESHPSYLEILVPSLLEILRQHRLTITVFVVGQDAALEKNRPMLRAIADAGHEIGNHSFRHEPWFHLYSPGEVETEIRSAEESIEQATGQRPVGFRGPGFSFSAETLKVLVRRKYLYDCSSLPTFLGPLARAYYFATAGEMSAEEREKRSKLYGTWKDGTRPLVPFSWLVEDQELVELPVTTMPGFRLPFHLSYLLFLRRYSRLAAWTYFRTSLALCRMSGISPSYLLHPLDFLGGDRVRELAFFPGMDLPTETKIEFVHEVLEGLKSSFDVVPLAEHARAVRAQPSGGGRRLNREFALG